MGYLSPRPECESRMPLFTRQLTCVTFSPVGMVTAV